LSATANGKAKKAGRPEERVLIYQLLLGTGLRSTELSLLTPSQIDFEKCRLRIEAIKTKNKKADILPLRLDLVQPLKERMETLGIKPHEQFFCYRQEGIRRAFYTDLKAAGITVGLFGKICFLPHLPKQMIQTLVSNDVSVELPQELYDAKGNFYPYPVRRVAITPDPAVSGMSPFVQQRDALVSVPFLTLSINNFTEEKETMPNDNDQLFDPDDIQDDTLPESDVDTDIDGDEDNVPSNPVSSKKKAAFLDSQLAKILFDALGIAPDDFDEEEELVAELNVRLTEMLTIQSRLLAALDIKKTNKNKFELLSTRVTELCEFLEQFDADGDGRVDDGAFDPP
jgi:hypothetical protein